MNIILSIKPKYVSKILDGTKKFEYRRTIPSFTCLRDDVSFLSSLELVDNVLIYATSPIKKVVACFSVYDVHYLSLGKIWEITREFSGISENDFYDYFCGKEYGYAIELCNVLGFDNYIDLKDFNIHVPQNFIYIDNKTYNNIVYEGINNQLKEIECVNCKNKNVILDECSLLECKFCNNELFI